MVSLIPFSAEHRQVIFWIVASALCLTGELMTARLIIFWFACSALGASYLADQGFGIETQFLFFIAIPIPLTIISQFIIRAVFEATPADISTKNLLGREAFVTEAINPKRKKGKIKIGEQEFNAKSKKIIEHGTKVIIQKFDGLDAIVKKL